MNLGNAASRDSLEFRRAAIGSVIVYLLTGLAGSTLSAILWLTQLGSLTTLDIVQTLALPGVLLAALVAVVIGDWRYRGALLIALALLSGALVLLLAMPLIRPAGRPDVAPSFGPLLLIVIPHLLAVAVVWMRYQNRLTVLESDHYANMVFFVAVLICVLGTGYACALLLGGRFTVTAFLPLLYASAAALLSSVVLVLTTAVTTAGKSTQPFALAACCIPIVGLAVARMISTPYLQATLPLPMLDLVSLLTAGGLLMIFSLITAASWHRRKTDIWMPTPSAPPTLLRIAPQSLPRAAAVAADPIPTARPAGPIPLAYHAASPVDRIHAIRDTVLKIVLAYAAIRVVGQVAQLASIDRSALLIFMLHPRYVATVLGLVLMIGTGAVLMAAIGGRRRLILPAAVLLIAAGFVSSVVGAALAGAMSWGTAVPMVPIVVAAMALHRVREQQKSTIPQRASPGPAALWGAAIFSGLLMASETHRLTAAAQSSGMTPSVYALAAMAVIGVLILARVLAPTPAGHRSAIILLVALALGVLAARVSQLIEGRPIGVWIVVLAGTIAPFVLLIGLNVVARRWARAPLAAS